MQNFVKINVVINMNFENVKIYGRNAEKSCIATDWTASGIEFSADCEGEIAITFFCPAQQNIYFSVFLDGAESRLLVNKEKSPSHEYTHRIAKALPRGEHHIRILRQSEAERGCCSITDISLCGTLLPLKREDKKLIEFIGDSITCGYANLATCDMPPEECSESPYEDGIQGYAFLTAEALGCDFSMLCRQGTGIVAGWDYLTNPMGAIPRVYELTSFYRDSRPYDFARKADLVVINLGTNDIYKHLGEERDENLTDDDFINTIFGVFEKIDRLNGGPEIVVAIGMMTNPVAQEPIYRWYGEAIARFQEKYNKKIHFCHLPENYEGGKAHPSVAGHRAAAAVLAEFIKKEGLI